MASSVAGAREVVTSAFRTIKLSLSRNNSESCASVVAEVIDHRTISGTSRDVEAIPFTSNNDSTCQAPEMGTAVSHDVNSTEESCTLNVRVALCAPAMGLDCSYHTQ